jgi:hypothetical protein
MLKHFVLQFIPIFARRDDFVGQVGNLRPIGNRPACSARNSGPTHAQSAACRYVGQVGNLRPIVNRPAALLAIPSRCAALLGKVCGIRLSPVAPAILSPVRFPRWASCQAARGLWPGDSAARGFAHNPKSPKATYSHPARYWPQAGLLLFPSVVSCRTCVPSTSMLQIW